MRQEDNCHCNNRYKIPSEMEVGRLVLKAAVSIMDGRQFILFKDQAPWCSPSWPVSHARTPSGGNGLGLPVVVLAPLCTNLTADVGQGFSMVDM